MELLKNIDSILIGWGISPDTAMIIDEFIALALILLIAFAADMLCRKVLLRVIARIVKQTKATWDDILFDHSVMVHLSRMVAPVVIYLCIPVAFAGSAAGAAGAVSAAAPPGANSANDSPSFPITITLVSTGISSLSLKKHARTVPSNLDSSSNEALSVS